MYPIRGVDNPGSSPLGSSEPAQSFSDAVDKRPDLSSPNQSTSEPVLQPQDREPPQPAIETTDSAVKVSPTIATAPTRSKPLSWQQRPNGLHGPRSRPASFLERRGTVRNQSSSPQPPKNDQQEPSRDDIAKSLAAKDPSWFRQTADRGEGSAALRRSQAQDEEKPLIEKKQLHGMSNKSPTPEQVESGAKCLVTPSSEPPSFVGSTQSKGSPLEGDTTIMSESSNATQEDKSLVSESSNHGRGELGSTTPVVSTNIRKEERQERTGSPTKGMGGFVQSAMLRRSDSINKRWNVPTGGGLSRVNSTTGSTSGRPGSRDQGLGLPTGTSRLDESNTFKRPDSRGHGSRPGSSHSSSLEKGKAMDDIQNTAGSPDRSRSKTLSDPNPDLRSNSKTPEPGLHSSPSKRWSPQKSSWLESALSKPETPKAKPPSLSQPAWLSDLQKNRQQRQSKDLGYLNSEGNNKGKSDLWGQPTRSISPEKSKTEPVHFDAPPTPRPKPARLSDGPIAQANVEREEGIMLPVVEAVEKDQQETPTLKQEFLEVRQKHEMPSKKNPNLNIEPSQPKEDHDIRFDISKPKPDTPPKKDLRSQLKSRSQPPNESDGAQLEFVNAAGKLKRTATQKYVAPDVLGDNIRRGKAGLTVTGGPQPNQRRDEFKESLIQQKERMREKAGEPEGKPAVPKKPESPIPEALARRQVLGRNDSNANVMSKPSMEKPLGNAEKATSSSSIRATTIDQGRSTSPPTVSAKLSGRFNPAIAGILARGPPSPTKDPATSTSSVTVASIPSPQFQDLVSSTKPLEHKTKGRARGPK